MSKRATAGSSSSPEQWSCWVELPAPSAPRPAFIPTMLIDLDPPAKTRARTRTRKRKPKRALPDAVPITPSASQQPKAPSASQASRTTRQSSAMLSQEQGQSQRQTTLTAYLSKGKGKGKGRQKDNEPGIQEPTLFFPSDDEGNHDSQPRPLPKPTVARQPSPPKQTQTQTQTKGKEKEKEEKKTNKDNKAKKRKKKKDEPHESDDDDDDDNDLRSNLNENAFVRSTGSTHKADFRNKLAKLQKQRKRAEKKRERERKRVIQLGDSDSDHTSLFGSSVQDDSDAQPAKRPRIRAVTVSSDSSSDDSSEQSSSESTSSIQSGTSTGSSATGSSGFIVEDDEVQIAPEKADKGKGKGKGKGKDRARSPRISLPSKDTSILSQFGLGIQRKSWQELCEEWIEWAVVRILVPFAKLEAKDRERLESARRALKQRLKSTEESLSSVGMRRQFKWYLEQYPKITVQLMFDDEARKIGGLAQLGCGACHRKSQRCSHMVRFHGRRYNQNTVGKLDPDSDDEESDISSGADDMAESSEDERGRHATRFYVGSFCAERALVMHALHHWEWETMQRLTKHAAIHQVEQDVAERGGVGIDGTDGAGAEEVRWCVEQLSFIRTYGPLTELERLRRHVGTLMSKALHTTRAT